MIHRASGPEWIFFDIGGTLLEIYRPMAEVMQDYLLRAGHVVPVDPIKAAVKQVVSTLPTRHPSYVNLDHNRGWWMTLYEETLRLATHDQNISTKTLFQVREAIWEQHRRGDNLRLYADAKGLLEILQERGFHLGVISNWDDTLPPILDRFGMLSYFEVIVVSMDHGHEKPARTIFEQALQQAGTLPENCAHVGDDWMCDIVGAAQLGIQPVWVERGVRAVVVQSAQPDAAPLLIDPIKVTSLSALTNYWKHEEK